MATSPTIRRLALLLALAAGLAATAFAAEQPSLVVVISVDQMRADYLDRFRPYFGRDGLNRFLEKGAVFTEARHRHSYPETAPGHASIGTGLDPRHHGILS
ncbi:MAG: alkaline phosphatase family protein, partial [Thermoanaerobaculia bacterium]